MYTFTILCTEEQTIKALELGANICKYPCIDGEYKGVCDIFPYTKAPNVIPTAEQMIGWLEQNARISDIDIFRSGSTYWSFYVTKFCGIIESKKEYFSRKEATLAAIDAALDYLTKIKEEKL